MRHLILGTAGHVDHGKTELVKALTGRDTDRLKEEKDRGISIELGFAPLSLDDGTFLGIVDVPGHERFVKHMVAGAGGIDLAMLLVAADEGVMPQTEEHMEVLRSLAIPGGLVVVSKSDLASEETMTILRDEVEDLTRGSFLEGAPVVNTSAKTGEGLAELKTTLGELAAGVPTRDTGGPFRQPVDRVFHRKGIGVVITGSCYSGAVKTGDTLEILPRGLTTRVRELQSFNDKRKEGFAGERLAVALQGIKLGEIARGDMLAAPGRFAVSKAVDARIHLAGYHEFEVKNRERLRIHHGAREVLGRVILLESEALRSGDDALVQISLEKPLVPAEGDRFVLRKYSPPRVIGGGVVIDPLPERHKRRDTGVIEQLKLKEQGDPVDVLLKAIERAGLRGLARNKVDTGQLEALIERNEVVQVEDVAFHRGVLDSLAEEVEDLTAAHQARFPLQWGMDKEELRQKTGFSHGTPLFNRVLESLGDFRPVFVKGNRVRSGGAEMDVPDSAREDLAALSEHIRGADVAFPSRPELEGRWRGVHRFADAVQYLKDRGEVIEVGKDGLIHREALDRCLETLKRLFEEREEISVADVKTALGVTRKHAIPLLETLDGRRITTRSGNHRVRGPKFPE
jgi:selenocysteine-specific elongation factor